MEYNSILQRIEEQKKDEDLSAKLFRYTGLIQAIEFFSQKLNFDQIIHAAFDFVNELLTIEKSAIFIAQGDNFVLKKLKGFGSDISIIKNDKNLQDIAAFHGTLIFDSEMLAKYFQKDVLEAYNVTSVIPLIIDFSLYGFIFISNKTVGEFNSDDFIISEALMKLFNNALENYKRYEELQKANSELDEKIFNLFAINQSSKALLSELNLDILYNLSVDVFSELTQSSVTGFVLYDERAEKYTLKAYKDIFYRRAGVETSLTINKRARLDVNRIVIDIANEADVKYFNNIFIEGIEALKDMKSCYVVLLIKNGKILGFVSLSTAVTGVQYRKSILELVESLASATYIALSNAQLFKQVNDQKKIIQGKLEKLVSLNSLMKNINNSLNVDTLINLTLKTLDVSFDVEKALIALYDNSKGIFEVKEALNLELDSTGLVPNAEWKKLMEGDSIYDAKTGAVSKYIGEGILNKADDCSGILLVPIHIERVEIEIIGCIIVFKYRKLLLDDEENRLTIEAISGHIAPVLRNLYTLEEQKKFLLPNHIEIFKKDLKKEVSEAMELSTELEIIQILDNRSFIFRENTIVDKLKERFPKVYPVTSNDIFVIINYIDSSIQEEIKRITGVDELAVKSFRLKTDFKSFQEFFGLFQ